MIVDARDVCLEVLLDAGDVHASLLRSEHELDRFHRTGALTQSVSNAPGRHHGKCLTGSDAEHVALRTHRRAVPDSDAELRAYAGRKRGRFLESVAEGFHVGGLGPLLLRVKSEDDRQGQHHRQREADCPDDRDIAHGATPLGAPETAPWHASHSRATGR